MKTMTVLKYSPLFAGLLLAGCSLAPAYKVPVVNTPAAFKEAAGQDWKTAQPADDKNRGQWWTVFGDSTLNTLETQAQADNQDLKAAAARLAQSRALRQAASSQWSPQVSAGFGPTREKPSPASLELAPNAPTSSYTLWREQASVSYEVDLFGRVASSVNAATADAQQNEALFQSVQLALQADVAQAYFLLRELDAEEALYTNTVASRTQTLDLLQKRFAAGYTGELDVARGQSELESAQAQALGLARERADAEHALAILLGKAPADFALSANPLQAVTVSIPAGLPSSLLERRPDIAAAERAMAAANARIGEARAAFFPSLNITGALGYESAQLSHISDWSSRTFLFGPLAGTMLSLPLFDGGLRKAGVKQARAVYEEQVADYRQTVLNSFREVEDGLADMRILGQQIQTQDAAVQAATHAANLSHRRYQEGSIGYLDVLEADRSVLLLQHDAVQLNGQRALAAVGLIRALGGDWAVPEKTAAAQNGTPVQLAKAQ